MFGGDGELTALIVDDGAGSAERIAGRLAEVDGPIAAVTAPDVSRALDRVEEADCVAVPTRPPNLDGVDLVATIDDAAPERPIVVLTGSGGDPTADPTIADLLDAGAADCAPVPKGGDEAILLANRLRLAVEVASTKERERALEGLHDVATDLERCESVEAVCERTVEAAEHVLSFDVCSISVEEDGSLPVKALSSELDENQTTTMSVEEGLAGKTYRTGESALVEDVSEVPEARPQGPFESALSIPVGDHGVFQVASGEPRFFDEADLELAELLVAHAAGALARIESRQDLREERERLRRQNERLDQFASVVSHDLQSPLTVAKGNIHLARVHEDDAYLEEADASLDRMEDIIDDLLALARSGERATDLVPVDLDAVAVEAWASVPHVGGDFRTECDGTVLADRSRLRGLLENLFRNAVTHAGPDVTVEIGALDDESGFYVADDGPGIPPDEREQIFEVGFTTSRAGSGFGLLIVREIAEAHGWEVAITESRWGGARFEVAGVEQAGGAER